MLDTNNRVQSYRQLRIDKPYIALNKETYISLHPQQLSTCKKIGYEYFVKNCLLLRASTNKAVPAQYTSI